MMYRALSILLLAGAGCFTAVPPPQNQPQPQPIQGQAAPPPNNTGPQQAPTQPPGPNYNSGLSVKASPETSSDSGLSMKAPPSDPAADQPAQNPSFGAPIPKKPAPVADPLENASFTKVLSWNVSGNTPLAAWSPNRSQLAVFSDYPQKEGERNGKKYLEIIDMKTGKSNSLGPVFASAYEPMWLDESTLVYLCTKDRCGKGKDGVYTLKTNGGKPQQIVAKSPEAYLALFPSRSGTLLIKREEYPPPRPDGSYPEPIQRWEEYDPKTKKLSAREDIPAQSWELPASMYRSQFCDAGFTTLYGFAENGKIGILNNTTQKKKVIVEAEIWPYYPGETYGHSPCFSPEGEYLVYYTYDSLKKQGNATLMKVTGLAQ